MRCVACNHRDTKVIETRLGADGLSIRRRRQCLKCRYRFSTLEAPEILDLTVVKRDGRREIYSREKLEAGLRKALQKRPITNQRFRDLVGAIERDIQRTRRDEITSGALGEVVMDQLKTFDKVAYIRFASVYRAFEDVDNFHQALAGLKGRRHKKKN